MAAQSRRQTSGQRCGAWRCIRRCGNANPKRLSSPPVPLPVKAGFNLLIIPLTPPPPPPVTTVATRLHVLSRSDSWFVTGPSAIRASRFESKRRQSSRLPWARANSKSQPRQLPYAESSHSLLCRGPSNSFLSAAASHRRTHTLRLNWIEPVIVPFVLHTPAPKNGAGTRRPPSFCCNRRLRLAERRSPGVRQGGPGTWQVRYGPVKPAA